MKTLIKFYLLFFFSVFVFLFIFLLVFFFPKASQIDIQNILNNLKFNNENNKTSGWLLKEFSNSTTQNFTDSFHNITRTNDEMINILNTIKDNYEIILIRGYLGYLIPLYFQEIYTKLKIFKFNVKKLNFVDKNFLSSLKNKNVLIICHSKGCNDILDATVYHPEIKNSIQGIIMMNAPIAGSIIASDLLSNNFHDEKMIIKENSLNQLSFEGRKKIFEENGYYDIKNLKIINYISYQNERKKKSLLKKFIDYINNNYLKKNDGLVILDDQILPGVPFVVDMADHTNVAFNSYIIMKLIIFWFKIFN